MYYLAVLSLILSYILYVQVEAVYEDQCNIQCSICPELDKYKKPVKCKTCKYAKYSVFMEV